jgi:hypothetical protein
LIFKHCRCGGLSPQNPAPTLPGAIAAARNTLQNNQACRDLFSKGNGLDLLNKLDKKGKIKIGDTGVPKTLSPTGRLKDAGDLGGVAKVFSDCVNRELQGKK